MRSTIGFFVSLSIIFCNVGWASELKPLVAYVVSDEAALDSNDVDEVTLNYNKSSETFVVVIHFSKSGKDKLNNLFKTNPKKKICFTLANDIVSGPVPIMLDSVNGPLSVVVKNSQTAIDVLRFLSK